MPCIVGIYWVHPLLKGSLPKGTGIFPMKSLQTYTCCISSVPAPEHRKQKHGTQLHPRVGWNLHFQRRRQAVHVKRLALAETSVVQRTPCSSYSLQAKGIFSNRPLSMTCATHVARGSLVKWACYGDLRALHHVVSCPGLSSVRPWTKRSFFFLEYETCDKHADKIRK